MKHDKHALFTAEYSCICKASFLYILGMTAPAQLQ